MKNKRVVKAAAAGAMFVGASLLGSGIASAHHSHYVHTPNGRCHQVAQGQTAINDPTHGGHHRYHDNVHIGGVRVLGNGNSEVIVETSC